MIFEKYKYRNIKKAVVILLFLSFNLVSAEGALNSCICHFGKVETKKTCCKEDSKTCQIPEEKPCCKKPVKKDCDNCSACKFEKGETKNDGSINDDKIIENQIKKQEASEYILQNIKPASNTNIFQERRDNYSPKLFLSNSILRI